MSVLVLGAAVSGAASVRLLESTGADVVVYDADPERASAVAAGRHRAAAGEWDPSVLDGVDLVVASPGIPPHAPPIADALAAGVTVWSEIELGARHLDCPLVAVTGTNGKTTVTELAAEILRHSGIEAAAVGNIGDALSDAVGGGHDVLVVETAALQLHFIDAFHAGAAVLLNIAPDHLDWFGGSFAAYRAAKMRVFENQTADDVVVFDADDDEAPSAVAAARSRPVPVSGTRRPPGGSGPEGDRLWIADVAVDLGSMVRSDPVFLVDAAAAGVAALHVGATPDGVRSALAAFRPSAHRRELVTEAGGIAWIDDSKATNPHAALAAIGSYPSVVLIAGGRNKDLDLSALGKHPNVRHLIGIGESGPEIVEAAGFGEVAGDMATAVAAAARAARPGDTVLLSPGCASFDMFRSYAHRGEVFAALVREVG
ncbi:MAG TPA: UDP-N-acetylmuramoyl-L-alanine--D-glutamate ligase [Acidimicrobiia bacterium]|nr:UDP-N-acetylmuramoyl-L-alanine--D-glutamate ligase [Acidimicrobiia bacterium]